MLIVSKFRDYYDSAVGFDGVDKTCVFNRVPSIEKSKQIEKLFDVETTHWRSGPYRYGTSYWGKHKPGEFSSITPFVVGFCGKTYVGYTFYRFLDSQLRIGEPEIVYGEDFFALKTFDTKGKYSSGKTDRDQLNAFLGKFHNKEHQELFIKHHTPIFIYDYGTNLSGLERPDGRYGALDEKVLILNPCLKNYGFYQVFNSASTFQEVQMYLQGVLGNKEKETPNLDEKHMLLKHGYDKWSFRKEPNKKK